MENNIDVLKVFSTHFPSYNVIRIIDRGAMVKRIFEVTLDNEKTYFLKVQTNSEWVGVEQEALVTRFFYNHNLPCPKLIAEDYTSDIIPYSYIIEECVGGLKLETLLQTLNLEQLSNIYEVIGEFYKKMHSIKNIQSGVWGDTPYDIKYPTHPARYMYQAEITNGSTLQAKDRGFITEYTYNRLNNIWRKNLTYLMDSDISLIHLSPFTWNIYLDESNDIWEVTKVMSLSDVMWWDPAYDIATIKYPPFGDHCKETWKAFISGYRRNYEEKRLLLYRLLHHVCAVMGTYLEPNTEAHSIWKKYKSANLDTDLNAIMDLIDSL